MTSTKKSAPSPADVEAFLETLDHPLKPEIVAVRQIILAADPSIGEEIKWNAPSFRTSEHFATMHLRAKDGLQVILHRGAKKRPPSGMDLADPDGLLQWLGPDRAAVTFCDLGDVQAKRAAFAAILRHWITYV